VKVSKKLVGTRQRKFNKYGFIRYADDFVITAQAKEDIEIVIPIVSEWLTHRGLTLSKEKTKIVNIEQGFNFLGFNIRIKQYAETLKGNKRDNRCSLSLIRYADDFVIIHEDVTVVQRCKEIISEWLQGMGLELKPSKTRLAHTLTQHEQEKPGFDFLGFKIQQFPIGKYHSKQGFKTIITPSKQKQKVHYDQIASVIETHKSAPQEELISHLNPIIRGWANYYATVVSKVAYSNIDSLMYQKLRAWAKRRHPKKSGKWVSKRYWHSISGNNWVFATKKEELIPLRLLDHADTPIVRHVKVKSESSPYDGNLVYWSSRMGKNPEMPSKVSKLLKKQKGKCTHCGLFFREDDVLEVDHKIPKSQGGKDLYDNLQLLHRHCHDTKTTNDSSPGTKSGCNSAEPKPTKRLDRVEDKWVMRYA
jgi:RNA-directed DNA polymerase